MDWILITLIVLILLCIIHSKTSINNQNEYIIYSNYQTADLMDKITEFFTEDETSEDKEEEESQFKKDMGETAIVVATDVFGMRKKTPEKLQLERKIEIAKIEADNAKHEAIKQKRT